MSRKLGTAINNNFDNTQMTINTRLAGSNNGDNNFFSGDLNKVTQITNAGDEPITVSTVLTNPCPNVIYVNFTTPGQTITLPPANGANGHWAGKPIWFKVAPTNSQNFSILENDGTTFLTAIGTTGNYSDFILSYSTNSNQNGTPIRLWTSINGANFLPVTGGTLTGNLVIDGGATGGFTGLDINKNANSALQFNLYNASNGASAGVQAVLLNGGGADLYFGAGVNGGNVVIHGFRISDNKYVFSKNNTLASGVLGTIDQNGAWTFTDILNTARGLLNGINSQSGTTYTLAAAADAFRKSIFTNASGCAITFNDSSAANGDEGIIQRAAGAGNITLVAGAGVTINSSPYQSLVISALNGRVGWWKTATNTYYVSGDLTP